MATKVKAKKKYVKYFKDLTFGTYIDVYINYPLEDVAKKVKFIGDINRDADWLCFNCWWTQKIAINSDVDDNDKLVILTHELYHAIGWLMWYKWFDKDVKDLGSDVWAYMYDYYFGKIYHWMKKEKIIK